MRLRGGLLPGQRAIAPSLREGSRAHRPCSPTRVGEKPWSRRETVEPAHHSEDIALFVEVDGDEVQESVAGALTPLSAPQER
jgi:hypothetical protein